MIKEALSNNPRTRLLADCEDSNKLLTDVMRLKPAAAVIALDPTNAELDFKLIKQLATTCAGTAIITAAYDTSPSLILRSIRSGASEFLQLPIVAEEFETVLDRVAEFWSSHRSATIKSGRIVGIFSNKGGTGVSFLATNLAAAMNVNTLLADLNLHVGDAA